MNRKLKVSHTKWAQSQALQSCPELFNTITVIIEGTYVSVNAPTTNDTVFAALLSFFILFAS